MGTAGRTRSLLSVLPAAAAVAVSTVCTVFADGLPGEYLVTQRWREMFGVHSPVANPAFVTEEDFWSLRAAWCPSMQFAYNLWEVGLTAPLGLFQSAGINWIGQDDGEVQQGSFDPSGRIVISDSTTRNTNNLFMLSYAVNPWRKLSVGANVTLAYQTNFGQPLMGTGLDLGVSYIVLDNPTLGKHVLGVATQNLLSPSMSRVPTPSFGDTGAYARDLKCSWYGRFLNNQLESGLDFDLKDFLAAKSEYQGSGNLEWDLSFRAGVWLMRVLNLYLQLGFDKHVIDYWGLAGGVNVPMVNGGRDMQVIYQYNQKADQYEASTHTFYVRVNFGRHRQESFKGFMKFSANELYNKACDLYWKGRFWDAFFVFGQLEQMFPTFFKMDWVEYYMGSCQAKLDMRSAAVRRLQAVKGKYPNSSVIPHADLALMRVYYRDRSLPDITNQYLELNRPGIPDSMKQEAYYLMGEAYAESGRYDEAVRVLLQIPDKSPWYVFGQQSAGVAYFCLGDTANAIQAMAASAQAPTRTADQREAANRSCVLLGYLYYESDQLSKAITALRMVPRGSFYYEDALLGQGWTAIKARQWGDCVAAGSELAGLTKHMVLKGEAAIMQAYGLLGQRRWAEALDVFKPIYDTIQSMRGPRQDSLEILQSKYREDRSLYDLFAADMNAHAHDLAVEPVEASIPATQLSKDSLRNQMSQNSRAIDSMRAVQGDIKKRLDDFLVFQDGFGRRTFFSRGIETVRNDVNYIYAVVQKHNSVTSAKKAADESQAKQKSIDAELEKLKKEAAELEKQDAGKPQDKAPGKKKDDRKKSTSGGSTQAPAGGGDDGSASVDEIR